MAGKVIWDIFVNKLQILQVKMTFHPQLLPHGDSNQLHWLRKLGPGASVCSISDTHAFHWRLGQLLFLYRHHLLLDFITV